MKTIIAKGYYTILLDRPAKGDGHSVVNFDIDLSHNLTASVTVDYDNSSIETTIPGISVSEEFVTKSSVCDSFNFEEMPAHLQKEISDISSLLSLAVRRVIRLIKYHLRHFYIKEQLFSIREQKWGLSETSLYDLPSSLHVTFDSCSISPLNNRSAQKIQKALNSKAEPLMAMRHLHRAKNEQIPHHKWVDATIAAELAVKEVLVRACPELEPLLLEVPSPPLAKLYGPILKNYLGEKSPYLSVIRNGVEVRNRLVHRPTEERIDGQKAIDYVRDIEAAIFHLLSKLYPDDELIKMNLD